MKTNKSYTGLMKKIVRRYLILLNEMYYWDTRADKAENEYTDKFCCDIRNDKAKAAAELGKLLSSEGVSEDDITDMHEYAEQQAKNGDIIKAEAEDKYFLPW